MGLRDFEVRREEIGLPNGDKFAVRGLGFNDVTRLMALYGPTLTILFNKFLGDVRLKSLTPEAMAFVINEVLKEAPEIAFKIIALGADEDGTKGESNIPLIGVVAQAEALSRIIELTLISEAEVKKLVEVVTKAFTGTAVVVEGLSSLRKGGSGESEEQ
jgi:hypothetical protein